MISPVWKKPSVFLAEVKESTSRADLSPLETRKMDQISKETITVAIDGELISHEVYVDECTKMDVDPNTGVFRTRSESEQLFRDGYAAGKVIREVIREARCYRDSETTPAKVFSHTAKIQETKNDSDKKPILVKYDYFILK